MAFLTWLLVLYILWDVNYFLHCVMTVFVGSLFQRKRAIGDTTTIYGDFSLVFSVRHCVLIDCSAL